MNDRINKLYLEDEYIAKNPLLHRKDSSWKMSKIIPLIEVFVSKIGRKEVNLLDVGGGAGLILNAAAIHMGKTHGIKVNKFALDLSPGMLEIQKKENPDLKKALNESVNKTSLLDKEIDLTLMIDVLEHLANPVEALEELKRVSKFVIFKVPLEDNLFLRTLNFLKKGKQRQDAMKSSGHINFYNFSTLKKQIERHMGQVISFSFTDVFDYYLRSEDYRNTLSTAMKLRHTIASYIFKISPRICSLVFNDFVMIIVRCD
jgi:ubiquinone/menaquinone biosynthesis C-methylase UbiE